MQLNLVDLLKGSATLASQTSLDDRVWCMIEGAGMKRWHKGDPAPDKGRRLLVGLASYSEADLQLAEDLIGRMRMLPDLTIEFFNVLDIRDMASFEDYIPGIGNVYQTPVIGLWEDGRLERAAQGFAAREWVKEFVLDCRK